MFTWAKELSCKCAIPFLIVFAFVFNVYSVLLTDKPIRGKNLSNYTISTRNQLERLSQMAHGVLVYVHDAVADLEI